MISTATRSRPITFVILLFAAAITGCSSVSSHLSTTPFQYVGSAGAISAVLVLPTNGATAVPISPQTIVFNGLSNYTIVLQAANDPSQLIKTTPTAVPSPYQTNSPGPGVGSGGYYAVSAPPLRPATTYAVGTLSDFNQNAGNFTFRQFGMFTTQ